VPFLNIYFINCFIFLSYAAAVTSYLDLTRDFVYSSMRLKPDTVDIKRNYGKRQKRIPFPKKGKKMQLFCIYTAPYTA